VLGVVLAAALMCSVALAGTAMQTYSQKFTTAHPGQATGMTLRWTTGPPPRSSLVVQPRTVTLTFPTGTKIDGGAVTRGAKVGSGTAVFGASTPARPVIAYDAGLTGITLVIPNSVGVSYSLNAKYTDMGRELVIRIPTFRIPPAVLTGLSLTIKGGSAKRPYLKTPSSCPTGGWKFSAVFVYSGLPTETLSSTSACVKH
jgi:hypothetical protein